MLKKQAEQDAKREREKLYQRNTLRRLENMTREDVEQVLQSRDTELSLPLIVQLLRCKCFNSRSALAEHLGKPSYWSKAFGEFLEREGIMSVGEFNGCFADRRGRSGVCSVRSLRSRKRKRELASKRK